MPLYVYKCPFDGSRRTLIRIKERRNDEALCEECGAAMKRDFAAEAPHTHYHPTRDMYAEKLKIGARKQTQARRRGEV